MKYLQRKKMTWADYLIAVVLFSGVAFISALAGAGFMMILYWIG